MAYFKYFPTIRYDVRGTKNDSNIQHVTDILKRVRKRLDIVNRAYFEQYFVKDGDTPESLSHQVYGDSTLHWIILYGNYMTNPYYDWPLTYIDLKKFVIKKYGEANINDTHHYEDADGYEVDSDAPTATAITNFLHEEALNDVKRTINIIKPEYTQQIISEFKKIIVE
jgi:small-conductance mechanosensitive channel